MKSAIAAFALTSALVAPGLAAARPVTFTTTLNNYGGDGAYLALYLTDASGAYAGTPMQKHIGLPVDFRHFDRWLRLFGVPEDRIDR